MHEPTRVRVFGRLVVERDGKVIVPPRGQARELLAIVAVRGPTSSEMVAELLWPGDAPAVSAVRLSNVLTRLRGRCGPVVCRDGGLLYLDAPTDLDAFRARVRVGDAQEAARIAAVGELAAEWPWAEWCADARREVAAALDRATRD